jgi:hypothetical protein
MPSSKRTAFAFFAKLFQLQNLSPAARLGSAKGFVGVEDANPDPDLCTETKEKTPKVRHHGVIHRGQKLIINPIGFRHSILVSHFSLHAR